MVAEETRCWLWCHRDRWHLAGDRTAVHSRPAEDARENLLLSLPDGTLFGISLVESPVGEDEWLPLRPLLAHAGAQEMALLSRAAQLLSWYRNHRFCSRCGTPTARHARDLCMHCPACGYQQYPRLSPCIIVLVTRGERMLLAHAARFDERRYSTLAGFVEAGESAEEAVHREVREEAGIGLRGLRYCFSQSWPFPHSLMLGFRAEYDSGELCADGEEILEARWFSADELGEIRLPPRFTIARRLIDDFLAELGAG